MNLNKIVSTRLVENNDKEEMNFKKIFPSHKENNDKEELNLNIMVPKRSVENNDYRNEKELFFQIKDINWNGIIKGTQPDKSNNIQLISQICPCKSSSKNENLLKFDNGQEMLMYDLNIITILKKLIEFEKFKEILFDKKQIDLMKLLHTRKIDSTPLEVKDLLKNKLYDMKNNEKIFINGLSYAYVRCLKSNNEIDKKIIQNLNL